MVQRPFNYAIVDEVDSILIDEARTPLIISGPTEDTSELYRRVDTRDPAPRRPTTTRRTRRTARRPDRRRHRGGRGHPARPTACCPRASASTTPTQISVLHHVDPGAARPQAVQARHRLHRQGRQGHHHRRVHRPHDGRPALVRRPAPGARGQGEGRDPAREPDAGLDHLPELLPHVPQAGRHDRHGADRGGRVRRDLQARGGRDPDQRRRSARKDDDDEIYRTLADKTRAIVKLDRGMPRAPASRCWSAPCRSRSRRRCRRSSKKARHPAQRAERPLPRAGSPDRRPGRPARRGHHRHQHGRPRHRHPARRQRRHAACARASRDHGQDRPTRPRARPRSPRVEAEIKAEVERDREIVLKAGGLYVVGTERHESRRIDNQLRGRSGRQGDPGASKFFLSLEDDLMRIFGNNKVLDWVQKKGMADDEALTHRWLNKALETAQGKVEARNFEIRKNLLRFDDVMNSQRKEIYKERVELMATEDVSDTVAGMRRDVVDAMVTRDHPRERLCRAVEDRRAQGRGAAPVRPRPAGRRLGQGRRHRRRGDQDAAERCRRPAVRPEARRSTARTSGARSRRAC